VRPFVDVVVVASPVQIENAPIYSDRRTAVADRASSEAVNAIDQGG
jgi:hypothetical protein